MSSTSTSGASLTCECEGSDRVFSLADSDRYPSTKPTREIHGSVPEPPRDAARVGSVYELGSCFVILLLCPAHTIQPPPLEAPLSPLPLLPLAASLAFHLTQTHPAPMGRPKISIEQKRANQAARQRRYRARERQQLEQLTEAVARLRNERKELRVALRNALETIESYQCPRSPVDHILQASEVLRRAPRC